MVKYFKSTWSGRLLLITVIVLILQWIPFTGIFLMMMAIVWPAFLIGAALICMIFEARNGAIPRTMIVLPIVYFGGYFFLLCSEYYMQYKIKNEIEKHNNTVSIKFDKDKDALFVNKYQVNNLLTKYDISRVYSPKHATKSIPHPYRVNFIAKQDLCSEAHKTGKNYGFRTDSVKSYNKIKDDSLYSRMGKSVRGVCLISYPESPKKPIYKISYKDKKENSFLLPHRIREILITAPNGEEYILKGGFYKPLRWYPLFMSGCGLNSAKAKWECGASILRKTFSVSFNDKQGGDIAAIALAIGLKPLPDDMRYKAKITSLDIYNIIEGIKKEIDQAEQEKLNEAYKEFDRFLNNPKGYIGKGKNGRAVFPDFDLEDDFMKSKNKEMVIALEKLKYKKSDYERTKVGEVSITGLLSEKNKISKE